jgi:serine/threonine protein kinase
VEENTFKEIPYKEIALKVGKITGYAYSISWKTRNVAVLKIDEITPEHKALASLSHPNVIPLLGYAIRPSGKFCLILPFDWQVSLSQKLYSQDYSFENGMRWVQEVCNGLGALHSAGLLHLNLNLETVVFNQEGHAILVDMDCLLSEDVRDTAETLPFIAPEILVKNKTPTQHSDFYSLGVLLLCCAEQKKPFGDLTLETIRHTLTVENRGITLSEKTPLKIAHLIESLCQANPLKRPGSMQEVSDTLKTALNPF